MKQDHGWVRMLIMLTQFGLSIAFPLAGFIVVALWLKNRFGLGSWVLVVGIVFGLVGAVDGFRSSIKAMEILSGKGKEKSEEEKHGYTHIHHS